MSIDGEVPVADQLSCLTSGISEAKAIDRIVKPQLQHLEQVLSGGTRAPPGVSEVAAELTFQHPIDMPSLLFLLEPDAVFR